MTAPRRILPIGIQSFAKIRKGNFYYVDKTPYALMLAQAAGYYFLSRPRRFGKSLFLDTLKELFEGNEALFAGLFIHDQWDWSVRHPVLHISFGGGNVKTALALGQMIHKQLERHERRFNLPARYPDARSRLADLIERLHEASGELVVVLVDEYDKPILDNLDQADIARAMREDLKDLYSVIKDSDAHIRLAFLTGVSKFSKVSLFSGINNLRDISIAAQYSAICGYTDADLNSVFAPELDGLDRHEIRRWYNGYNWLGDAVYNPYDLLLLFQERKFSAYWFETATPTFLIAMITTRQVWLPSLENMVAPSTLLSAFDVDYISTEALMFQSGYVTLDSEHSVAGKVFYRLRFPNEEVRQSLFGSLLEVWGGHAGGQVRNSLNLYELLTSQNLNADQLAQLERIFQSFFSGIPHQWFTKNKIAEYEGYYASVFYAYFVAAGLNVRVEDATNVGRIDMTVLLPQHILLFEFKVVDANASGAALQQIKDKRYFDKYCAAGLPIYLVGVEFSRNTRNVVGFACELWQPDSLR